MLQEAILTEFAEQLVAIEPGAKVEVIKNTCRDTYQQLKFVQIDDFIQEGVLTRMIERVLPEARKYGIRKEIPHKISPGLLHDGNRYERIDWSPPPVEGELSEEQKQKLRAIFQAGGLDPFAKQLAALIQPFLEFIVGRKLRYDKVFLFVYREGDFRDPHGASSTSPRVLAQMPVSFASRGAIRVLKNGFLEPFVDEPGCLRLLGAGMWHDVPPVLRLYRDQAPLRVVVSLRFPFV